MSERVYISGPMSGHKDLNRQAFLAAFHYLRDKGFTPVNPHDLKHSPHDNWNECMRTDLAELVRCDAVVVLPFWSGSRGATIEVCVAHSLGIPVFDLTLQPVDVSMYVNTDRMREVFFPSD